jgi:broad specificity phosphatase PhoE
MKKLFLCRHGETEWSRDGKHTSFTDLPLTERGEEEARALAQRIGGKSFDLVLTSPLLRASRTCELAGLSAEVCPEAVEWNYGDYEGLTTPEIHKRDPGWTVFKRRGPNGESAADVGARADAVIARAMQANGDVALFSHGHFLRVLAARWIGLDVTWGKAFSLGTATLSVLGYERDEPAILLWNDQLYFARVRSGGV